MRGGNFDRSAQDVGNIVFLEHVNVRVPDQVIATRFYIAGLGLTRDPYLMVSTENMWANAGQSQFHLPTGAPNVLPGHVELVVPDLGALRERLEEVSSKLAGTQFAFANEDKHVRVTCPWGNTFRCFAPAPEFGDVTLGLARVEVPVRPGTAAGIARFYQTVFNAPGASPATAAVPRPASASASSGRSWCSARRRGTSVPLTAITSRCTSPTSPGRMPASRSAASSPRRAATSSTASRRSWIWTPARRSPPWSTRCAASPIRCISGP